MRHYYGLRYFVNHPPNPSRVPLGSVPNGNRRVSWLIVLAWIFAILCAAPMTFVLILRLFTFFLLFSIFRGTRPIPRTSFVQCYHLQEFKPGQIMAWVYVYSLDLMLISHFPIFIISPSPFSFHFFHVVTTFYLPLVAILFCYVSIGLSLRTQGASLRQTNLANTDQHKRLQQNTKLRFLKATAAIVCTFVLSWLPYQVDHSFSGAVKYFLPKVMALLRVVCEPESKCEQVTSNFNWLQSILLARYFLPTVSLQSF